MPKKGSKARRYFDDLKAMVALTTGEPLTSLREGYIREAWPALKRLSSIIVALAPLRGLDAPPQSATKAQQQAAGDEINRIEDV